MSFMKVSGIGRLGKDPEVRTGNGGKEFCSFSVAVSESYKDKQGETKTDTSWYNVTCNNGLAEVAKNHLKKGDQVFLEGKFKPRKFNGSSGLDISLDVFATNIHLIGNNRASGNDADNTDFNPEEYDQPPANATESKAKSKAKGK